MATQQLPKEVRGGMRRMMMAIDSIYEHLTDDLLKVIIKIKSEADLEFYKPELHSIITQAGKDTEYYIGTYSKFSADLALTRNLRDFKQLRIDTKLPDSWGDYLKIMNNMVRRDMTYYTLHRWNDGKNLTDRIKTIIHGTEQTVESLIKLGISEGEDAISLAKRIAQYIHPDRRSKVVAPWSIIRREKGLPVSFVPKKVPAGAVDFNAYRIARTEVAQHYRWMTIDSSKNLDFVVGWQWMLSGSHPVPDICDDWAGYDEGYGPGVYTDPIAISLLGHPFCLCFVQTITAFHRQFKEFYKKAREEMNLSDGVWGAIGYNS